MRELVHPNRSGMMVGIHFSPDGKRVIAGDYPGGQAVVWEVATGKQLRTIETGSGYRGSADYLHVARDGQAFLISRGKQKTERLEQAGKRPYRYEYDGEVRAWDPTAGRVVWTFRHQPPRNVFRMALSPDGTSFVTLEYSPGTFERHPPPAMSLWDARTGQCLPLPAGLGLPSGAFSPDGRALLLADVDENAFTRALKLFDPATGQEKSSIPVPDKRARVSYPVFSPDGRLLVGDYQVTERANQQRHWLKWWDTVTGREVASVAGNQGGSFYNPRFTPDGQILAVYSLCGEERHVRFFRVRDRQLLGTVLLVKGSPGELLRTPDAGISPDGQWLAVTTQAVPKDFAGAEDDVQDVPQPRIHLLDVAAGEIRATLVSPQCFIRSACFSPDGRTLATGGHGRVLLWDLTRLPGAPPPAR